MDGVILGRLYEMVVFMNRMVTFITRTVNYVTRTVDLLPEW